MPCYTLLFPLTRVFLGVSALIKRQCKCCATQQSVNGKRILKEFLPPGKFPADETGYVCWICGINLGRQTVKEQYLLHRIRSSTCACARAQNLRRLLQRPFVSGDRLVYTCCEGVSMPVCN